MRVRKSPFIFHPGLRNELFNGEDVSHQLRVATCQLCMPGADLVKVQPRLCAYTAWSGGRSNCSLGSARRGTFCKAAFWHVVSWKCNFQSISHFSLSVFRVTTELPRQIISC